MRMMFSDEWLVATVQSLLPEGQLDALRPASDANQVSLWETLVERRVATNEQIVALLAARFRLRVADLSQMDAHAKEGVPESLFRRFNVIPLRMTDAFLEVATANPFDIDAEKMLAFASGREVRMLLGSPSKIREKLDELYRGNEEGRAADCAPRAHRGADRSRRRRPRRCRADRCACGRAHGQLYGDRKSVV